MVKKIFNMVIHILFWAGIVILVLMSATRIYSGIAAKPLIKTVETVSPERVAIVFGAGLERNGAPTPVLRDRVETAAELYKAGKVEKLLFSGDNRFIDYNEPGAMREYALQLGVPEDAIVLDYAGRRTYDTCYRAKHIFGVDEVILVTQSYHLPRALITCNGLGIQSVGVSADRRIYSRIPYLIWNIREVPATLATFWDVWISHPLPVLGSEEPIFPKDNG